MRLVSAAIGASQDEIVTALNAAGVVEYRPYASNDPDLMKLRHNPVKYDPGQPTVDKIVSTLWAMTQRHPRRADPLQVRAPASPCLLGSAL